MLVFEPEAQCWLLMASRLTEQGEFNRGHCWQSCGRNDTLAYRDLATHNISMTKEHRPRADRRDTLNSELGHETLGAGLYSAEQLSHPLERLFIAWLVAGCADGFRHLEIGDTLRSS